MCFEHLKLTTTPALAEACMEVPNDIGLLEVAHSKHSYFSHLDPEVSKRLEKLGAWRLHASQIGFSESGCKAEGGFATVSRAIMVLPIPEGEEETTTQKAMDVAVKQMKISDREDRNRILGLALREAQFLVDSKHENIVQLHGFVENILADKIWLIFPWAENGNLRDFVASADWEVPERIWLIDGVIQGLSYLHGQEPPICHGDIKSVNILVAASYHAVITDFGSARRIRSKPARPDDQSKKNLSEPGLEAIISEANNTNTLTKNNFSLRWAAPEVLKDEDKGTAADIWSFGWVCYEVMTGKIPFENIQNESVITLNICKGKLPSLDDQARMALIRRLGSLMIDCWSSNAQDRPRATACMRAISWMPRCAPGVRKSRPELLLQLGDIYLSLRDYLQARNSFEEALHLSNEADDTCPNKVYALRCLADVHRIFNNVGTAESLYTDCIRLCDQACNFPTQRAYALWGLAELYTKRSEYTKAISLYTECFKSSEEISNDEGKANALCGLADLYLTQREYGKALPLYVECMQLCTQIGDEARKAYVMNGLAGVYRMQNESSQAVALYSGCAQISERMGLKAQWASALWGLGETYRCLLQYENAISMYTQSFKTFDEVGDIAGKAGNLLGLAHIRRGQSQINKAISLYQQAAELLQEVGFSRHVAEALKAAAGLREPVSELLSSSP